MTSLKNRYIATLHGCAYGDTLGMAVEGWKRERIRKYVGRITEPLEPVIVRDAAGNEIREDEFGELKYWTRGLQRGDWTDDTIFTAVIAESIAYARGLDLNDIAKRHLNLYRELPAAAYGKTTRDSLENLANGVSPQESGVIGGPGNGPAMKMAPVGMYMHAAGKYGEGLKFARDVARMTHHDPRSIVSGMAQAHAIYHLLNNATRDEFIRGLMQVVDTEEWPVKDGVHTWAKKGSLLSRILWIVEHIGVTPDEAHVHLGSSSAVYQSYPFALWMFQKYGFDTPGKAIEGMLDTINYGGDCDTTGAIYGTLCGARHGLVFPSSWAFVTRDLKKLTLLAKEICELKTI